ncbi:MAG: hypothetical protein IPK26_06720 [Planctomycetes bacterium]|nr:hypothetical protein [Planctomycetota bacterium]
MHVSRIVPAAFGVLLAAQETPPRPPGAEGRLAHTGAFVIGRGQPTQWQKPAFAYDAKVATGSKHAKVVVVIYDPILEAHGGVRLTQHVKAADPLHYSRILVDVIRQASWGYLDYEIVDVLTIDGYPRKIDGFRYDDDTYLAARAKNDWQPAPSSYRSILAENDLIERSKKEGITEVWLWGAPGFHFDEFAGFVKDRYQRFGPTDNEWLYRPYDIPGDELGRTFWIMGFNYEVGPDNMVHSYTHRVESQCALAFGDGIWDPKTLRDPWNAFTLLEMDFPGFPSMVGNCHVPPNGQSGYDYGNARAVPSFADQWARYPDLRGTPRPVSKEDWGGTQFGYQKWILERLPKGPGYTAHGYANWWVYIGNVDGDLPELAVPAPAGGPLMLPEGLPAVAGK